MCVCECVCVIVYILLLVSVYKEITMIPIPFCFRLIEGGPSTLVVESTGAHTPEVAVKVCQLQHNWLVGCRFYHFQFFLSKKQTFQMIEKN